MTEQCVNIKTTKKCLCDNCNPECEERKELMDMDIKKPFIIAVKKTIIIKEKKQVKVILIDTHEEMELINKLEYIDLIEKMTYEELIEENEKDNEYKDILKKAIEHKKAEAQTTEIVNRDNQAK